MQCLVCKKPITTTTAVILKEITSGKTYSAHKECLPLDRVAQSKLATFPIAHGDDKSIDTVTQSID